MLSHVHGRYNVKHVVLIRRSCIQVLQALNGFGLKLGRGKWCYVQYKNVNTFTVTCLQSSLTLRLLTSGYSGGYSGGYLGGDSTQTETYGLCAESFQRITLSSSDDIVIYRSFSAYGQEVA